MSTDRYNPYGKNVYKHHVAMSYASHIVKSINSLPMSIVLTWLHQCAYFWLVTEIFLLDIYEYSGGLYCSAISPKTSYSWMKISTILASMISYQIKHYVIFWGKRLQLMLFDSVLFLISWLPTSPTFHLVFLTLTRSAKTLRWQTILFC